MNDPMKSILKHYNRNVFDVPSGASGRTEYIAMTDTSEKDLKRELQATKNRSVWQKVIGIFLTILGGSQ